MFKQLNDKASFNYSPYNYFPDYDFSIFERGRRANEIDWAMFSSLYVFSCNVLPESIKAELSLAKELRISEENVKKFIKKIPEKLHFFQNKKPEFLQKIAKLIFWNFLQNLPKKIQKYF